MNDHTSTIIDEPKYCDFCNDGDAKVKAAYDAQTEMGSWAFMCEEHYKRYGVGLGLGVGQRLIVKGEQWFHLTGRS